MEADADASDFECLEVKRLSPTKLDRQELEQLYRDCAVGLRIFLVGVLKRDDLAEDALQQTFVILAEKGEFADPAHRKGWLYKVALRHALELRRRGMRERGVLEASGRVSMLDGLPTTLDTMERSERLAELRRCVEKLPSTQRDVLLFRIRDNLTFAQIAERIDAPLGTVLTRARAGLAQLKRRMNDD